MSYDPYGDNRRREAEIRQRENQRFWDKTLADIQKSGQPPPAYGPGETADGLARFLLMIFVVPFVWVASRIWHGDLARPWSRPRKLFAVLTGVGFILGWTGNALLPAQDQGLAWILGALSTLGLVVAIVPRTSLILAVLIGALGIYVEFIAV